MYTGQFVMSGFLDMQISQWQRISITRSVALVPTLLVSLLYRQPGGTELDTLNEWLNVLQSMQIPFALLPVHLPLCALPCAPQADDLCAPAGTCLPVCSPCVPPGAPSCASPAS